MMHRDIPVVDVAATVIVKLFSDQGEPASLVLFDGSTPERAALRQAMEAIQIRLDRLGGDSLSVPMAE